MPLRIARSTERCFGRTAMGPGAKRADSCTHQAPSGFGCSWRQQNCAVCPTALSVLDQGDAILDSCLACVLTSTLSHWCFSIAIADIPRSWRRKAWSQPCGRQGLRSLHGQFILMSFRRSTYLEKMSFPLLHSFGTSERWIPRASWQFFITTVGHR